MRCKKHVTDPSSIIGVCATCLRDRLFVVIAAQAQEDRRRSENNASPLVFPRSVSPYISRRKSDNSTTETWHHLPQTQQEGLHHQRLRNTHLDPAGKLAVGADEKKKGLGFSFFTSPFTSSKPEKIDPDVSCSVPGQSDSGSCTSSRSWFSAILLGRRRKINRTYSLDEPSIGAQRRVIRNADKGMSPSRHSDEETENWNYHTTGSLPAYTNPRKETPKRTPVLVPPDKRGGHNRNGSGIGFCLSPLVRASPSRHLSQKGMKPEMVVSGDMGVVLVRRSQANTTGFDKNRSKKMCDFGRCQHNR